MRIIAIKNDGSSEVFEDVVAIQNTDIGVEISIADSDYALDDNDIFYKYLDKLEVHKLTIFLV